MIENRFRLIRLDAAVYGEEALLGLADFSHLEVIFHFHRVPEDEIETGAGIRVAIPTGHWWASSRSGARTAPTGWVCHGARW
ncbi:hypothetical protein [Streptomyces decoyicus]|uniref:hypothetical protein n=1 Tax=Streptomyces decoyicus TaxID=249567 RepID=UPI0037F15497